MTEPRRPRGIGRLLAPLALAGVVIAIFLLVGSSSDEPVTSTGAGNGNGQVNGGGGGGGGGGNGGNEPAEGKSSPKKYTVAEGDTLTSIAEEFGISVDEILQLNPKVDPQALTTGETLKLR